MDEDFHGSVEVREKFMIGFAVIDLRELIEGPSLSQYKLLDSRLRQLGNGVFEFRNVASRGKPRACPGKVILDVSCADLPPPEKGDDGLDVVVAMATRNEFNVNKLAVADVTEMIS